MANTKTKMVNDLQELMVDYLEEVISLDDLITKVEDQPTIVINTLYNLVTEEYDFWADRQEEHDDRTLKLHHAIERLENILP